MKLILFMKISRLTIQKLKYHNKSVKLQTNLSKNKALEIKTTGAPVSRCLNGGLKFIIVG